MSKRRVAVTGLGVVAPNGIGADPFWQASLGGKSGIAAVASFDASECDSRIAGIVSGFDPLQWLPRKLAGTTDRFAHLGLAAAQMALDDSRLDLAQADRTRVGVIIGSGMGGALFHEEQMQAVHDRGIRALSPMGVPRITPNAVSSHIAIRHGLLGPNLTISTACASSAHAIGEAMEKIRAGGIDVAFAGGAEAPLTRLTFAAYSMLRALSRRNAEPERASRPFDRDRDGFVLAEGAAVLILEELAHAAARGARIYAELAGYGVSSGAHHMVIPDPTGHDAARAMQLALLDAGIPPGDVGYINAHGTSTPPNDLAETKAIKEVFGEAAYRIPISSIKSMIGHTIGAAGAIEAAACCLALRNQAIPPTINYETPDPECDLDYVPNVARKADLNVVLSNSFGFGNTNACLVFTRFA